MAEMRTPRFELAGLNFSAATSRLYGELFAQSRLKPERT
jgi:hypothetical protein